MSGDKALNRLAGAMPVHEVIVTSLEPRERIIVDFYATTPSDEWVFLDVGDASTILTPKEARRLAKALRIAAKEAAR